MLVEGGARLRQTPWPCRRRAGGGVAGLGFLVYVAFKMRGNIDERSERNGKKALIGGGGGVSENRGP